MICEKSLAEKGQPQEWRRGQEKQKQGKGTRIMKKGKGKKEEAQEGRRQYLYDQRSPMTTSNVLAHTTRSDLPVGHTPNP